MLHQIGLFLHIIAIILVAGGAMASIMAENQLWKKVKQHDGGAKAFLPILKKAPIGIRIGAILFLVSGFAMLYSVNWVFFSQPWFIAKLTLFVMLPLRGAFIAEPVINKIAALVNTPGKTGNYNLPELMKLRSRMNMFHIIQYSVVAIIVFLVIFKI